jgi:hypothetical protein
MIVFNKSEIKESGKHVILLDDGSELTISYNKLVELWYVTLVSCMRVREVWYMGNDFEEAYATFSKLADQ